MIMGTKPSTPPYTVYHAGYEQGLDLPVRQHPVDYITEKTEERSQPVNGQRTVIKGKAVEPVKNHSHN